MRRVGFSTGVLLALLAAGTAWAQEENVAPAAVETDDSARVFVDTTVEDIIIDEQLTVAIMAPSPQSPCPSDQYIFERERPKWLNTTGRLLQAQKEGATLRISFSCIRGYQSINAIQFLSPPPGAMAMATPRRSQVIETTPNARAVLAARQAPRPGALTPPTPTAPVPGADAATETRRVERLRAIPLPQQASAQRPAPPPPGGAPSPTPVPPGAFAAAPGALDQPYVNERVRAIPLP